MTPSADCTAPLGRARCARFEVWRPAWGSIRRTGAWPAEDLATFFDRVDYPLYVVTVRSPDGEMSGCLAGFVTQCSIDPPNFLV